MSENCLSQHYAVAALDRGHHRSRASPRPKQALYPGGPDRKVFQLNSSRYLYGSFVTFVVESMITVLVLIDLLQRLHAYVHRLAHRPQSTAR